MLSLPAPNLQNSLVLNVQLEWRETNTRDPTQYYGNRLDNPPLIFLLEDIVRASIIEHARRTT